MPILVARASLLSFTVVTLVALAAARAAPSAASDDVAARAERLFDRRNLVAWCIVPFDAEQRGPEDRAAMLERLGLRHFAYDWRQEHVPSFEQEWDALARHGITLDAFWSIPPDLDGLLAGFSRRGLTPALWLMIDAPADLAPERVAHAAARVRPIAEAAARAGCRVSLYNHGGWGGEPETMVAVCRALACRVWASPTTSTTATNTCRGSARRSA